jgi:cardiolipin synthase
VAFLRQFRAAPNLLTLLRLFILPFLVINILDAHWKVAFADKLLLSTLFLVLTHVHAIPRYVTILVFSRDLGILVIATLLFATNTLRDFHPSIFGKINTLVQIIAVVGIMGSHVLAIPYLVETNGALLKLIAVLAPLSAAQYAWIVIRRVSTPIDPLLTH